MAVSTNIAPDVVNANSLVYNPQGGSTNVALRSDNFGNAGVNSVFGRWTELARNGNLYVATMIQAATPIAGVVAVPTTTSGQILFNGAAAGSGIVVIPLRISVSLKSTTAGQGLTILAGLAGGALATPLTANGSSMTCINTLDGVTKDSTTFTDINKTVVQPNYEFLASAGQPAGATSGIGTAMTVTPEGSHIVRPGFAFDVSVLGPTGSTPLYFVSILYAKIKMDVGTAQ